jgi:hypothetical protein
VINHNLMAMNGPAIWHRVWALSPDQRLSLAFACTRGRRRRGLASPSYARGQQDMNQGVRNANDAFPNPTADGALGVLTRSSSA